MNQTVYMMIAIWSYLGLLIGVPMMLHTSLWGYRQEVSKAVWWNVVCGIGATIIHFTPFPAA